MTESVALPRTEPKHDDGTTGKLMRAIVRTGYGKADNVLHLKEVEKPAPDEARGVLVKVHAASVNPADRYDVNPPLLIRLISPIFRLGMGVRRPKDPGLGTDAAGRVEAVSSNVTQFKPGDEVFGACKGSYAEYAVAREDRLVLKPANVSFEQAAAVPIAGITALQALRDKGNLKPGQKVLVSGAGGGVGTYAVQIAKALGGKVTAVTSTKNLELVRSLGADHVIDYTKEDFAKTGERYDLICEIAGTHSISDYKRILKPNGTCVIIGWKDKVIQRLLYYSLYSLLLLKGRGDKKFRFFIAKINQKDLTFLADLLATGKVVSVIDGRYPLSEIAEAVRRIEQGNAKGKIIITTAGQK
jgi:NADPH:quinone reductase-like Zn-dependent oxidoreductase